MQHFQTMPSQATATENPGLCGECVHARRIESDRGSPFYQCQLSFTDPRFAKYPRLPVLVCSGYVRGEQEAHL
jgi:hypothetical protein